MKSIEVEYQRYCKLLEFAGKPSPMFEDYVVSKGLKLEDYLTIEDMVDRNL